MKFILQTECRRGLRIISEIPSISPGRLEGYNGIGKTAAIRLLHLCSGQQPYLHDDQAWTTFRDQLVSAKVVASNLAGIERIEWELSPKSWPRRPEPPGAWLGYIRIDGHQARLSDLSDLLQVHRIAGDETFTETLASRIDILRSTLEGWRTEGGDERLRDLELTLGQLQVELQATEATSIQSEISAVANAERNVEVADIEATELSIRVQLLERAAEAADRLDEVRARGPELDQQISQLVRQQIALLAQREKLEIAIVRASEQESKNAAAKREFELAEKYLANQEAQLSAIRSRISRLAAALGVPAESSQLNKLHEDAVQRLHELNRQLPRLHSAPLMADLLEHIAALLSKATQTNDLGDMIVFQGSILRDITVSQLSELMDEGARFWRNQVPSAGAEQLESDIENVKEVLIIHNQIKTALAESEQLQARYQRAKTRLAAATDDLPSETAKTVRSLIDERNVLDAQRDEIEDRLVHMRHAKGLLGGGLTEEALLRQLVSLSREVQIESSRVRGKLTEERQRLRVANERLGESRRQLENAQRILSERTESLEQIASRLNHSPDFTWLRGVSPNVVPDEHGSLEARASQVAQLSRLLEFARERVRRSQEIAIGVPDALQDLSSQLRGRAPASGTWVSAVRKWLEDDVGEMFSNEQVREALFPGGEDVSLDLTEMVISWVAPEGPLSRPLSGFSSGEQALAYTRARIAALDALPHSANRLIALDEFGAFIDAERMARLATYLQERADASPADHILVILPTSASRHPEGQGDRAGARRQQLADRGYFVERLVS